MVKSFDDRLWKLAVLKNALENLYPWEENTALSFRIIPLLDKYFPMEYAGNRNIVFWCKLEAEIMPDHVHISDRCRPTIRHPSCGQGNGRSSRWLKVPLSTVGTQARRRRCSGRMVLGQDWITTPKCPPPSCIRKTIRKTQIDPIVEHTSRQNILPSVPCRNGSWRS
jgi:hypothetical protein